MFSLLFALALAGDPEPLAPIDVDTELDVLTQTEDARAALREAGEKLGTWTLSIAGEDIDGPRLIALADTAPDEPFLRVVREQLGQPVDLPDFLLLLDDVLAAGDAGRRGEPFWISAGRLRSAGAFLHPDDVFKKGRPRRWANKPTLHVDQPVPQEGLEPPPPGAGPDPRWTALYTNPPDEPAHWTALAAENASFADRLQLLVAQLRAQDVEVYVTSTVRYRERGYLMWGAFELSRAKSEADVERIAAMLDAVQEEWELDVPIVWRHPDGWRATVEAARAMAESYDVVYATRKGAQFSNHYGGQAADLVALRLPRELTLSAPDGETHTWDLSDPEQARDLSLTPEVITWIEKHFGIDKLTSDYPHWGDARR
ncbi:MAG: hypothetical protein EP330_15350 [Deltaproteobacteria bacterium]|nr:MAG: hypothetical protein EP330_15350 [Deltaproteobacteria bacterium]